MSTHLRHGRAWRRHDLARVKRARSHYWTVNPRLENQVCPARLGKVARTPAPCSCWMCGNPRRTPKDWLTLAERRATHAQEDGMLEAREAGLLPRFSPWPDRGQP